MFACPHCQKAIEIAPKSEVPFWRQNLTPGLSTGSLVAIAFVFLMCSGSLNSRDSVDRLQNEVAALTKQVSELKSSIELLAVRKIETEVAPP